MNNEDKFLVGVIAGYIVIALLENQRQKGWSSSIKPIDQSEVIYPNAVPIMPDTIPNLNLG
jgi:hypothetical protein